MVLPFGSIASPAKNTRLATGSASFSAALLQSILKNHALIDGNKRLGWLATAVFLELNGESPSKMSNDAVYELVYGVAAGDAEIDEIATLIQAAVEGL